MAEGDTGLSGASEQPARGRRGKLEHSHPGGSAAAMGVRLMRFSGAQGLTLGLSNLVHYGSIVAVGWFLGPGDLGRFALLFFYTALLSQVIHIATKPGTFRRVFGTGGEDEDDFDDDDDEKDVSRNPPRTLGVGISWTALLSLIVVGISFAFSRPVASWLLGDSDQWRLVVVASVTGGALAMFRLAELVLWFERRPWAYAFADVSRPAFNLIAVIAFLAAGSGVGGAVIGQMAGTTISTLFVLFMMRDSFIPAFSLRESIQIFFAGRLRIPIASSMWIIQNADSFLLSRFVNHSDLGLYNFASRTGFMVALLPQGFRVALRPMKKSAGYRALRREYGQSVAQGQLLTYFVLLCMTAVLAMVMGGELLITIAPPEFASAAPLIPLSAAAMVMPALFRTVNGMSIVENGRTWFIGGVIFAAVAYIGITLFLGPRIGIYAPAVAMLIAFAVPAIVAIFRSQRGEDPLDIPYLALLRALGVGVAIALVFHFSHPDNKWIELVMVIAFMGVWFFLLLALKVVPEHHRAPLAHMAKSLLGGSAMRFDPYKGLHKMNPERRVKLRKAVTDKLPTATLGDEGDDPAAFVPSTNGGNDGEELGRELVAALRRTGRRGGVPMQPPSELDSAIALFLFAREPQSSRTARMRTLLSSGADSHDLRVLEELAERLEKAPARAWDAEPRPEPGLRLGERLRGIRSTPARKAP